MVHVDGASASPREGERMGKISLKFPAGVSDFNTIVDPTSHYAFIDRTLSMTTFLVNKGTCFLLLRPRRSGKTMFLSMIEEFLVREDCRTSSFKVDFEKMEIFLKMKRLKGEKSLSFEEEQELLRLENVWQRRGQYPVLSFSLKGSSRKETVQSAIQSVAKRYKALLYASPRLSATERKKFQRLVRGEPQYWERSLLDLTMLVQKHFDSKVVVLIDEYDAFLNFSLKSGMEEGVREFLHSLLCLGLKDNPCIEVCVVAGVTRFVKTRSLSGLNHMVVNDLVFPGSLACTFGFTQSDVMKLLDQCDETKGVCIKDLEEWYNGYRVGGQQIYNPWSVMSALKSGILKSYWTQTGSVESIIKVISARRDILSSMTKLYFLNEYVELSASVLSRSLASVCLDDMETACDIFWYTLLQTGYLSIVTQDKLSVQLGIPNKEVRIEFNNILGQLKRGTENLGKSSLKKFVENNDVSELMSELKRVLDACSCKNLTCEQSYHSLLFGILFHALHDWLVISEGESGYGFFDIGLIPPDDNISSTATVIEIKYVKKEQKEDKLLKTAQEAVQQIMTKNYSSFFTRFSHVRKVAQVGICFSGKTFRHAMKVVNIRKRKL
uniref:AAA-ATPase-like domain-containing protein n=1 Tax=Palpitomonas bilix TaxID=652834 RepID=A0A7S3DB18_9EUKA|mmetsp:Transcript_29399/g.75798  ORF Transcript_29399/g.75798 Transcript_29399/m.75798 type:complete len:608 (+) Transcript_29399:166-1989(+)